MTSHSHRPHPPQQRHQHALTNPSICSLSNGCTAFPVPVPERFPPIEELPPPSVFPRLTTAAGLRYELGATNPAGATPEPAAPSGTESRRCSASNPLLPAATGPWLLAPVLGAAAVTLSAAAVAEAAVVAVAVVEILSAVSCPAVAATVAVLSSADATPSRALKFAASARGVAVAVAVAVSRALSPAPAPTTAAAFALFSSSIGVAVLGERHPDLGLCSCRRRTGCVEVFWRTRAAVNELIGVELVGGRFWWCAIDERQRRSRTPGPNPVSAGRRLRHDLIGEWHHVAGELLGRVWMMFA